MGLQVQPIELKVAQDFCTLVHRHHGQPQGHRFSLGAVDSETGKLLGVAVMGRPVARNTPQDKVLEVTRLATDGSRNCCSLLYAAAARAAKAMGYCKIQTFILESEIGTSLKASGWVLEDPAAGGKHWDKSRPNRKPPIPGLRQRWSKTLNADWTPITGLPELASETEPQTALF